MTNPNDDVIAEFRANSGSVTQAMGGALAGLDLSCSTTTDASRASPYTTPVAAMAYADGYLLLGSFAGAAAEPQWVKNLENATKVTVETPARTTTMIPAVLRDGPERDQLYQTARQHWPFVHSGTTSANTAAPSRSSPGP